MRTRPLKPVRVLLLAALAALLVGCVASEKARYGRHLSAVVQPGPAPSEDVAIAFRLDEYRTPALARGANR